MLSSFADSRPSWRSFSASQGSGATIFYYFATLFQLGTDLVLGASDYSSYAGLVSSGTIPPVNEAVSKSDATGLIQVNNHLTNPALPVGAIEVKFSAVNRIMDIADPATFENFLIQAHVEVWSKDPFVACSRKIVDFSPTGFGTGLLGSDAIGQDFGMTGGNPGDRSGIGVKQANGLYLRSLPVNLPNLPAVESPRTFYFTAVVSPQQVPAAADIDIPPYYTTDPDAQAVIDAIQLSVTLTPDEKAALNARIVAFKTNGIWTNLIAYYGFLGDPTINWRNPAQYKLTPHGSLTVSSSGVAGDGSTGYYDTGIVPNSVFSSDDVALGYYVNSVPSSSVNNFYQSLGCETSYTQTLRFYSYSSDATNFSHWYENVNRNSVSSDAGYTSTVKAGDWLASRLGSANRIYLDGSPVHDSTPFAGSSLPTSPIAIFAHNASGTAYDFSASRFGSVIIATGLSDAQVLSNHTSEQTYQTALGRAN